AGGDRGFVVQPPPGAGSAAYYLAFLRGAGGKPALPPDSVRLVPVDTVQADTVAVQLIMVRQLQGLATDSAKAAWARAFHGELLALLQGHGIVVDTATQIYDPTGGPFTVDYDTAGVYIPGLRRPNAGNFYLIDRIKYTDASNSTILGYAVREVFDIATHPESRVVLNVRGGDAVAMAVTAAHEMGHFLGLRHTTATEADREG